ncbi:DNA-binding protein [Sphingobacterium spiritivorum]|uniref:DNA-binding protein n=1 Tax=Sphingobacterium spiritivorum TaxID=258 RepID=UPI0019191A3C|nr:DNA-binding protein [Sphingobacterium spiritivorum]QQT24332.1 DNA-binding protein [Sphingobacterium spiritivorum]
MKLKKLIFLMLISLKAVSQPFNAAPFQGIGNTGIALGGIYSLTNNPAGLVEIDELNVAVAYQKYFLMQDIQTQAAYFALPLKELGAIGFSVHSYGIPSLSSFLRTNISYARNFADILSTSVSLNYHRKSVAKYGGEQVMSFDLGLQYACNPSLTVGFIFKNITNAVLKGAVTDRIVQEIGAGTNYRISSGLMVNVDLISDLQERWFVRSGLEYRLHPSLVVRGGVSSNPIEYFAGLGFVLPRVRIDLSSSFHPNLGTSPQIALAYGL